VLQSNVHNFISGIGDDTTRVGVDALEKVIISLGMSDEHGFLTFHKEFMVRHNKHKLWFLRQVGSIFHPGLFS